MRQKITKTDLLSITFLLLIAGFLRFQNFGAIEHNVDRAYPLWQALRTLDQGVFPVTAQGTSVLFDNPALMGYLLLPATALTRTPVAAYVFVILLNWMAVAFIYSIVRRMRRTSIEALLAAFLFAINPWIIEYSRLTWVQGLLPFFVCLLFWLLVPVLCGTSRRPQRDLLLALITLTALTQTYLLAFAMLAPVGLLVVLFRKQILPLWKGWLPGLVIFALATGIYGAGLLANAQTGAQLTNFTSTGWHLSDEAFQHAVRLISGRDYAVARGMEAPIQDSILRQTLSDAAHITILCLLLIGIGFALYQAIRRQDRFSLILLIWFFLPILMMTFVSRVVHPFYLLLTLPAGHILAATGVRVLFIRIPQRAVFVPRFALLVACCAFGVLSGINSARYAEQTYAKPTANGLTALPLRDGIAMGQTFLKPAIGDQRTVVYADADEWILNTFVGQLFPVDRDVDINKLVYVPGVNGYYQQYLYVLREPVLSQSILNSAPLVGQYKFPDNRGFYAYQSSSEWRANSINLIVQDFLSSKEGLGLNWSHVVCYPETHQMRVLTIWTMSATPEKSGAETLYAPYIHVFDLTGKRLAIGDGRAISNRQWRPGDVYLQTTTIDIPADAIPTKLVIGQYDGVHQKTLEMHPFGRYSETQNTFEMDIPDWSFGEKCQYGRG